MATQQASGVGPNMGEPRQPCACGNPRCKLVAAPGSAFATQHHPDAAVRSARMREVRKGRSVDFSAYRDDPVGFAVDVLGVEPWSRQAEFLRAVAEHDRVALKAGQKVSKTNSLAIIMLWFAKTRPNARVFYTNSGERQVGTVNYPELKRLARRARKPIGIKVIHDTPGKGIVFEDEAEIIGFATNEEDNWGGLSGENLLFIVDEASGVPSSLFEAIEGNCAGDNAKLVVCGNPLRPADYFYNCFNSQSASWHCMTISSLESPNVVEGREVIRGMAGRRYVERVRDSYGEGSPFWCARVIGEFPAQSEYSVIALADVVGATLRGRTALADVTQPLVCGLDVGRFGDDESVACFVRGNVVLGIHAFRQCDGPTLAGRVAEVAQKYRQRLDHGFERLRVRVDVIGVGASPYDAMKAYDWIDAEPICVSEKATVDDHYANLRAQLWFECAAWLKTGAIPDDAKLHGELTAPTYSFNIKGDRQVEDKAQIKKRLKRSPDRADSLCLATYSRRHSSAAKFSAAMKALRQREYGTRPVPETKPAAVVAVEVDRSLPILKGALS